MNKLPKNLRDWKAKNPTNITQSMNNKILKQFVSNLWKYVKTSNLKFIILQYVENKFNIHDKIKMICDNLSCINV